MAKVDNQQAGPSAFRFLSRAGSGFSALVIIAIVIACSFGLASLWRRYQPVMATSHCISAQSIVITDPPPWIVTDLKQEAIVTGSLEGANLSDEDLTVRVAEAFRMHSWVSKVLRVSKRYPDSILVQLEYRRPVAMVEVRVGDQPGLFPIDADGTLLPTADFTAERAKHYPRISIPNASPLGFPGSPWGDDRVHDAAIIATALAPYWERLGLYRIALLGGLAQNRGKSDNVFRLTTRDHVNVIWGHAPGKEHPNETSTDKKIARLLSLKEQNGLTGIHPNEAIDSAQSRQTRHGSAAAGIALKPRTVRHRVAGASLRSPSELPVVTQVPRRWGCADLPQPP